MRAETEQDILAAKAIGEQYDEACKRELNNKEIIAPILQMVVPEYEDCTVEDVIRCIDAESISPDVPVDDIPVNMEGLPTEFTSVSEKTVRFDTHFKAVNPKRAGENVVICLHIDIEVQNDYKPGNPAYPIIKRAVYYGAREISRQLGSATREKDYGKLEKVYSIWICSENIPPHLRGTVTGYDFRKRDIIGETDEPEEDFDLLSVIVIRRGKEADGQGIFDYLDGIFTGNLGKISGYVDVGGNEKIRKEVAEVDGMGMSLWKKALAQGVEQGIAQGMTQGIAQGMTQGITQGRQEGMDDAIRKLADYYMQSDPTLTEEAAVEQASKILR